MSYDILFVPRRPGQSWDAALDEAEGRDVLGDAIRPERLEQWERVVHALRRRVGDVEVTVDRDVCEAAHSSGLLVSLYPDEASLTFPYLERADRPAFHDVVVDVVGILERETGLRAWDAQTDEPFDGRVHDDAGLEASRRIGQEASDTAATEAMADRAAAGAVGPDTGPVDLTTIPQTGPESVTGAPGTAPGTAPATAPGTGAEVDAVVALQRRRGRRYVVVGVVVVIASVLLAQQGQSSTLTGVAAALGVADIIIGLLMYRGAARRQAGAVDSGPDQR